MFVVYTQSVWSSPWSVLIVMVVKRQVYRWVEFTSHAVLMVLHCS